MGSLCLHTEATVIVDAQSFACNECAWAETKMRMKSIDVESGEPKDKMVYLDYVLSKLKLALRDAEEMRSELTTAIHHTAEYVGPDILPANSGWSWYCALERYAPGLAEIHANERCEFMHCNVKATRTVGTQGNDFAPSCLKHVNDFVSVYLSMGVEGINVKHLKPFTHAEGAPDTASEATTAGEG